MSWFRDISGVGFICTQQQNPALQNKKTQNSKIPMTMFFQKNPSISASAGSNAALSQCQCKGIQCECYRYGERCTMRCGCHALCVRRPTAPNIGTNENGSVKPPKPKLDAPNRGCRCGAGKRSCKTTATAKCPCRAALQHCTEACRCTAQCTNNSILTLSKTGRHYFVDPAVESPRVVVVVLAGRNDMRYAFEWCDKPRNDADRKTQKPHAIEEIVQYLTDAFKTYKMPDLQHIFMYMSKSPCFHQDCVPPCQVLTQCNQPKACARLISVTYGQWRRILNTVNVQMTVKFLAPYTRRGDLYTQQGILHMMQAGISVEPLVMKEWIEQMGNDSAPRVHTKSQRHTSVALWAKYTLDRYVRQSQQYINACRRTVDEQDIFWTSTFHDLLKKTTMAASLTQRRFDEIAIKVQHMSRPDQQQRENEMMIRKARSRPTVAADWGDDEPDDERRRTDSNPTTVLTPSLWPDQRAMPDEYDVTDHMQTQPAPINEDELYLCALSATSPAVRPSLQTHIQPPVSQQKRKSVSGSGAGRRPLRSWFSISRGRKKTTQQAEERRRSRSAAQLPIGAHHEGEGRTGDPGVDTPPRSITLDSVAEVRSVDKNIDDDRSTERSHEDLTAYDDQVTTMSKTSAISGMSARMPTQLHSTSSAGGMPMSGLMGLVAQATARSAMVAQSVGETILRESEPRIHDATRIILNFSARKISNDERRQMAKEMAVAVNRINNDIRALLNYLEQKAAATPV